MNSLQRPAGWAIRPLFEVATLQRGYDLPVQAREEGEYPIFAANGPVGFHAFAKCKGPGVVTGRSGTIGKVHFVPGDYWPLNTSLYVTDFHGNDPKWVYYMLQDFGLERFSQGAGVPTLNRNLVHGEPVKVPPFAEQRRIAAILDKADNLRTKRREALAQLDRLAQSIFLEMFGDPVTNPKNWPLRKFDEVCPTRLGKMLDQKQQTGQHKRKYLRNANVQWFRFELSDVLEMDFDEEARTTFLLKDGDLLICEGGEPGRAAIWRSQISECYYQKALHRGRPDPALAHSEYLVWLLWCLAQHGGLNDHVTLATIAHLTGEKLKAMQVPLPPISLQARFLERLRAQERLRSMAEEASKKQDALFESLQQRCFAGEL